MSPSPHWHACRGGLWGRSVDSWCRVGGGRGGIGGGEGGGLLVYSVLASEGRMEGLKFEFYGLGSKGGGQKQAGKEIWKVNADGGHCQPDGSVHSGLPQTCCDAHKLLDHHPTTFRCTQMPSPPPPGTS